MWIRKNKLIIWTLVLIVLILILFVAVYMVVWSGSGDSQIIEVGTQEDSSGIFYLDQEENFSSLSSRQRGKKGFFRILDGLAYAVYEPLRALGAVNVRANIEGENVYILAQPDVKNVSWDYQFDFNDFEPNKSKARFKLDNFLLGQKVNPFTSTLTDNLKSEPFAILLTYSADNSSQPIQLLSGDLSMKQDSMQIELDFNSGKIVYELPDFFLGVQHTLVVGFTGEEIYFFVDGELVDKKKTGNISLKNIVVVDNANIIKDKTDIYIHKKNKIVNLGKKSCQDFNESIWLRESSLIEDVNHGPFMIYLKWIPTKEVDNQRLIGFKSWAIWQNKESLRFAVGRMNTGAWRSVDYSLDSNFFGKEHNLIAIYNPSKDKIRDGYLDFYIDNILVGRQYIGKERIADSYWYNKDGGQLIFGGGNAGRESFFKGTICNAKFSFNKAPLNKVKKVDFISNARRIKVPLFGENGILKRVEIIVEPDR